MFNVPTIAREGYICYLRPESGRLLTFYVVSNLTTAQLRPRID